MNSSLPQVPLLIGATGHRDLVPDQVDRLRATVRRWLGDLQERFGKAALQVVTSLAPGADLLVMEEAFALSIESLAVLPLPVDLCRADFTDPDEQRRFDIALARCRQVIICPLAPGLTLEGVSQPGEGRTTQYAAAGEIVAGAAFILLALWDGRPPTHRAGTARTVEYRLSRRAWLSRRDDPTAHLDLAPHLPTETVYHLVASRQSSEVAAGLVPFQEGYRSTLEGPLETALPENLLLVAARTQALNQDIQMFGKTAPTTDLATELTGELAALPSNVAACGRLFTAVDRMASQLRRQVRRSIRVNGAATLFMGFCLILYVHSDGQGFRGSLIIGFLLSFVLVSLLNYLIRSSERQRRHLEARALAEGLRVELFWTLAGVPVPGGPPAAHRKLLKQTDPGLEWIPYVIRATSLLLVESRHAGIPGGLDFTIRKWIGTDGDTAGSSEQLRYFAQAGQTKARHAHLADAFTTVAVAIALLVAATLAVGFLMGNPLEPWRTYLLLTAGLLPLMTGLLEDYIQKTADRELKRQYDYMHGVFRNARDRLLKAASDAERRIILRSLGEAALSEHAEWLYLHRDRPIDRARLQ